MGTPYHKLSFEEETTRGEAGVKSVIAPPTLDSRIGQLEVSFEFLRQKTHGELENRKWLLIMIVTIIGVCVAAATLVSGMVKDSIQSNRDIHARYYDLLIENNKKIESSELVYLKLQVCLGTKNYWQYKDCIKF